MMHTVAAIQMISSPSVEDNLATARRLVAQAAAGGAQIMAVGNYLLHHFVDTQFLRFVGAHVPSVAVMAIKAAHQAALHKQHKAQAGAVDRAAALDGVHNAFAVVMTVAV